MKFDLDVCIEKAGKLLLNHILYHEMNWQKQDLMNLH